MSGLIWIQTVCKDRKETTKFVAGWERVNISVLLNKIMLSPICDFKQLWSLNIMGGIENKQVPDQQLAVKFQNANAWIYSFVSYATAGLSIVKPS